MVAQREAFKEAWRRRFGAPLGVWVVEFQPRRRRPVSQQQAPHLHLYLGLPDEVSEEEFHGLVVRVLRRRRLEKKYGKYRARGMVRRPTGEFSDWMLKTWTRVVMGDVARERPLVADITPAFWSEHAGAIANRVRIAEYFWRESGKWGQKTPPDGFGGLAFYGRWGGRAAGFVPIEGCRVIDEHVFYILRRVYRRMIDGKLRREAAQRGLKYRPYKGPRGRDGLTLFMADAVANAVRLEEWASAEAMRKMVELAIERQ
jgi:hypothetical protein